MVVRHDGPGAALSQCAGDSSVLWLHLFCCRSFLLGLIEAAASWDVFSVRIASLHLRWFMHMLVTRVCFLSLSLLNKS